MNSLSVLVYDDIDETAHSWADRIRETCGATAVAAGADDFQSLFEEIHSRREKSRKEGSAATECYDHDVDKADIVVVDYDLFSILRYNRHDRKQISLSSSLFFQMWLHHHS